MARGLATISARSTEAKKEGAGSESMAIDIASVNDMSNEGRQGKEDENTIPVIRASRAEVSSLVVGGVVVLFSFLWWKHVLS